MKGLAQVSGGDNDFVIAVTLDIDALRSFQSRAKRWTHEGDKLNQYLVDSDYVNTVENCLQGKQKHKS